MTDNPQTKPTHRFNSIILNIFGVFECFTVAHIVFVAIKAMHDYNSADDSTGVGSLVLIMGVVMGGGACILMLFAGIGLIKRKKYGRVLNIIISILLIIGMLQNLSMDNWDCDVGEIAILAGSIFLLAFMFLPETKRQFPKTNS